MILLCRCAKADVLSSATREQVLRWLAGSGREATVVDDLCGLAAARDPALGAAGGAGRVTVVACHARAVRWLLHFAGLSVPAERLTVLDMRERTADEIIAALESEPYPVPPQSPCAEIPPASETGASESRPSSGKNDAPDRSLAFSRTQTPATATPGAGWVPWFPVIDYDRCTNCRQCLGFCLFGVYASDEGGAVRVANPSRCKTNCPACARTCPQVAIMFPKYSEGPISGREVLPEDLSRGDLRVKPARQRADIQAALRARGGLAGVEPITVSPSETVSARRNIEIRSTKSETNPKSE